MSPLLSRVSNSQGITGLSGFRRAFLGRSTGTGGYIIPRSLRFDGSRSTSYLGRSITGTSTTYTVSMWAKKCANGLAYPYLFTSADTGAGLSGFGFQTGDQFNIYTNGGHNPTTSVYRDLSAWYHIVVSVNSGTAIVYINGEQISGYSIADCQLSGTCYIGAIDPPAYGSQYYFDGYISEFYLIDGQALSSTSFGEFDVSTGVWNPIEYTGTYGTNGAYLNFDNPATAATVCEDASGNNNHFTPNNITALGQVSPESDVITSISTGGSGVKQYVWTGGGLWDGTTYTGTLPVNLSDLESNGTLTSGQVTLSSNQCLILVPEGDESGSVFTANDGTLKFGLAQPAGHYNSSGSYLGGSGSYGNTESTSFLWGNTNYNATYRLDNRAAYIVLGNRGTAGTAASAGDMATVADEYSPTSTLTFASNQNLTKFYTGDDVAQDAGGISADTGPWGEGFYTATAYNASFNSSTLVTTIQSGTSWTVASGNTADVLRIDTLRLGDYSLSLTHTGGNNLYITTTDDPTTTTATNNPSPTTWHLIGNNVTSFTLTNGAGATSSTQKRYISIAGGSSGGTTFTITGSTKPVAIGTVDSVNTSANTMTLSSVEGTFSANTSNYVIGPNTFDSNKDVDTLLDSPTNGDSTDDTGLGGQLVGNYCTWNPLSKYQSSANIKPENGNLEVAQTPSGYAGTISGTIAIPKTGKWYWEVGSSTASFGNILAGVETAPQVNYAGSDNGASLPLYAGGSVYAVSPITLNTPAPTWSVPSSTSDIFGFAVDMDAGELYLYYNGTIQNGGNFIVNNLDLVTEPLFPSMNSHSGSRSITNFGQRPFKYPVAGYKCLCTANLPNPTIADGSTAMDVVLYSGTGTTQSISGLKFSPDLVWTKNKGAAEHNVLYDIVRGAGNLIRTSEAGTEVNAPSRFLSFDTNGYTIGSGSAENNASSNSYVAWAWDAGSTFMPKVYGDAATVSNTAALSTNLLGTASPSPVPQSIQNYDIDFGGNVTSVDIKYTYTSASNIQYLTSTNGSTWTSHSTNNTQTGGATETITSGTAFRYLRFHSPSGNFNQGIQWVNNTNGSIDSTSLVNASAGFSVVSWTGTGASGTVGHGLNAAPQLLIIKNRDSAYNWIVGSPYLTSWDYELKLNVVDAQYQSGSVTFNSTAPTSSVFSVGSTGSTNFSGHGMIAYCFTPISGYSAFGTYTGNLSADGPFIYTGMRPRWILLKSATDAREWTIWDTARDTYNSAGLYIYPHGPTPVAEQGSAGGNRLDILSNGFKIRSAAGFVNETSQTFVWAAFAEHPFKTSRAR